MAYSEFLRGLRHNGFKFDLVRKKIRTYAGVLREAEAYIEAADFCSLTKSEAPAKGAEKKPSQQDSADQKKEGKKRKEVWVADAQPQKSKKVKAYEPQFEFNKDCYSILMEIKDKFEFEKPQPLRGSAQYRNKNKYCHYHKDVGHDTNDCINLKRLLDKLAEKGMLNSYVMKSKFTYTRTNNTSEQRQKNDKNKDKEDKEDDGNNTDSGFVAVISGGFASGGPIMKGIKQDARNLGKVMQMDSVKAEPFPEVIISEADRGEVKALHNDPMVFIMKIANLKVGRILIDTGSAVDIISLAALKNISFPEDALHYITHQLVEFGGNVIHLVGRTYLPVRFGQKGEGRDMVVRFLFVKELTRYNVILGRPTLNVAKAVIVPHLMLLKFERTDGKIGTIQGSQKMAKECNQLAVKPIARGPKSSEPKEEGTSLPTHQVGQKRKAAKIEQA
ncbi:uncharacterized protein LOC110682831 [Chenopodium quinoa]|uniref:uncharacterized protein LOC110682831 n=1 Tax=Chenopodium quinoa TaxID=63459 RepID=UPI000B77E509|nr:uncharacterized protein LOC110682831 [Chenopodium quinoa]